MNFKGKLQVSTIGIQIMTRWLETIQIYNDDMKVKTFESSLNKLIVRFVAGDNF